MKHEERPVSILRSSFPPEIINYSVWVYHRFCLSFRDVEDLLAERGIVTYETIRLWCQKFGPDSNLLAKRNGFFPSTPSLRIFSSSAAFAEIDQHRLLRSWSFASWRTETTSRGRPGATDHHEPKGLRPAQLDNAHAGHRATVYGHLTSCGQSSENLQNA